MAASDNEGTALPKKENRKVQIRISKKYGSIRNFPRAFYADTKYVDRESCEVTDNPKSASRKSWQHPKVFPGGPPPQY